MIRHIITDADLQKALRARARRNGGSLSDLCMAASKLAMQEWNEARGVPTDILMHGLAVNQRGRKSPAQLKATGNPMSAIAVPTNYAERQDPEALLKLVIQRRTQMLSDGYDITVGNFVQRVGASVRFMPARYRYRFMRKIMDRPISLFLTNLGVVWPRMENGKPTGETAVTRVGDMDIVDVHSSVGTTENNGLALILRTFLNRFYMILAVGLNKTSERDGKEFSRLVAKKTLSYL